MRLGALVGVLLLSCSSPPDSSKQESPPKQRLTVSTHLDEFKLKVGTIRALKVRSADEVWFCGTEGKWGYTKDGGKHWQVDSLEFLANKAQFRSLEITEEGTLYLMTIQNPAAVFRSVDQGKNWQQVLEDTTTGAFFDCLKFWDEQHGLLLGDPIDGEFSIYRTEDGGDNWMKVDSSNLPDALPHEAPFAASNSNIAVQGSQAWFITGGKSASRVFHSSDYGKSWEVYPSPIISGDVMTGIYSIDFFDENQGVIAGGNWDSVQLDCPSLALTKDGGKNWKLINQDSAQGYFSSIRFVPGVGAQQVLALKGRARPAQSEMIYSGNQGKDWQRLSNDGYLCLEFASDTVAWVSGQNKIARLTFHD